MTSEKYTYYLDLGNGFEKLDLQENKLQYKFTRDKDDLAKITKSIEGEFTLGQPQFTKIDNLSKYGQTKDIPFRVYENGDSTTGTLIFDGFTNKFNGFDYNEKKVTTKEFNTDTVFQEFLSLFEKEVWIQPGFWNLFDTGVKPIYCNLDYSGKKITDYSITLCEVIKGMFQQYYDTILPPFICTPELFWFNTNIKKFEPEKYRIANLKDINGFGSGNARKLSLKRLFEILRIMHKIYWCNDNGIIKFKTLYDLATTQLDLSEQVKNKNRKLLNYGLNIKSEGITMNDNNSLTPGDNYLYAKNKIVYNGTSNKANEYNISEVCTRYTEEATDYNTDGFFFAYVDPATNKLISVNQEGLSSGYDNCKLSLRSLIMDNYTDGLYIDNENYSFAGNNAVEKPFHLAPFIEVPEITIVLPSIYNFIDSYISEITSDNRKIVLVYEQITDLKTNQTILKGYEFANTKYYKPPIIIQPPPVITDELSLDVNILTVDQAGDTITIHVTSNTHWDLTINGDWIHTSVSTGGNGVTAINVTIDASTIQRFGSLVFYTDEISLTLNVAQSVIIPPVDVITVTPGYIEVERLESTVNLDIVSSGNWSVTQSESWMHFSFNSGTGNSTIVMTIDSTIVDRQGYVTFTCGTQTCRIVVQQHLNLVALDVSPENLGFLYYGESKTFDITTPGAWSIASSQSWCTVDVSSGTGNATINATCGAALVARTAIITITNGSYTKYVNISQDGEPAYINADKNAIQFDKNGGAQTIVITSNTNWSVTPSDSWINCSIVGGSGNGSFTVSVGSTSVARNSTIILSNGTISRTIIVGQSYVPDLPTIAVTPGYNNVPLAGKSINLLVTVQNSSSGWTIDSYPSWVHFSQTTGTGGETIVITVDFAAAPRTTNITFRISGASSTINVNQY